MAQNDMLKRYLDAGMAFSQMTRDRAEAIVKDLVKAGEIRRKEAEQQIEELLERSRKNTDELLEIIRKEVADQLRALGLEDLAKKASSKRGATGSSKAKKATSGGGARGSKSDGDGRDPDATPKPQPVAEPAPEESDPNDSPAAKKAPAKAAKAAKKAPAKKEPPAEESPVGADLPAKRAQRAKKSGPSA